MPSRALPSSLAWLAALVLLAVAAAIAGGAGLYVETVHARRVQADAITGGDWRRGRSAVERYGCGSCHVVPGVAAAVGKVGPDLTHVGQRAALAGALRQDPETMVRWLMHPQALRPGSGMPEQGVTQRDARDMAAYLYAED